MLITGYLFTEEISTLIMSLFSICCFSSSLFIETELSKKEKLNRVPLQMPYLIWCSSWGSTLIYNIPGLGSAYVLLWYRKTSVKKRVRKNSPIFKQTNKHTSATKTAEKSSSHWCWRLPVGLKLSQLSRWLLAVGPVLPLCPELLRGKTSIPQQMI